VRFRQHHLGQQQRIDHTAQRINSHGRITP
jgi:hypothetical protein